MKTLVCDRFDAEALARLRSALTVTTSESLQPTASELEETEALIIRSRTKITPELLALAPRLRFIVTATSGFDHIDLTATQARGLTVAFTPNANAPSACELTWSLLLASARHLASAHRHVKSGEWRKDSLTGHQLGGKTLGIVGLGRIGSRVAKVASAFGMKVIAYDPYIEAPAFEEAHATRVGFEELLKLADAVTFHVPSTPETRYMLTQQGLEAMARHAILVNTSRGTVVREADLYAALTEGWIAACGLDVFEKEPLPRDSRLLGLTNLIMTPHVGAFTFEAFQAASHEAATKTLAFARGETVGDELPPRAPWVDAKFFTKSLKKPSEGRSGS